MRNGFKRSVLVEPICITVVMRRFIHFKFKNNMLKANELRIGNLVQSCGDIISVEYVDKLLLKGIFHRDNIYNTSIQVKHCKAIPLTVEWLIKFNVNEIKKQCPLRVNYVKYLKMDNEFNYCLCFYFDEDGYVDNVFRKIKYVHELQNLHFALTGVELQLSSNVA